MCISPSRRGIGQKERGYGRFKSASRKIAEVRDAIKNSADGLQDRRAVYATRKSFLEKSGRIGQLMRYMKEIEPAQKADFGKKVNELKSWAVDYFDSLDEKMKQKELQSRYESEKIDITLPSTHRQVGCLHPVTQVRNQLIDVFSGMGFTIYDIFCHDMM